LIHGTYNFGNRLVACRNAYCTTCQSSRFADGRRSLVVLHIAFIPVLPIATTVRWFCSSCRNEIDARRPSRPWILIAGALFGLLMTFVGVMVLREGVEKEAAYGCLLFGPLLVIGLIYLIRKQNYRIYLSARDDVEPLSGDHCPYCTSPLFAADKPHCHSCKIDIYTQ
jgi:uncharacterized paraquat-inducible protein A